MKIIITILNYIDIAAPLLALFFFIKPFKKMVKELHYVFYFVLVQFATNTTALIMQTVFDVPNYVAYAANVILSFAILALLFYRMNSRSLKKLVPVSAVVFTVVTVYSLWSLDGIDSYSSIVSALASFIITACCLVFFYWRLVHDTKTPGLTNSALFWIIIGIFTYYTGSFFIFISYNYLIQKNADSIGILWRFHNVLLTIFCIYTIYGLTCKNYQKT
ncbi:hypothetical protein GWC95_00545 [Sediminibacterium roseum]|uniref:YhhN-like protein n=1 Tax=Sediminibacterium roseum TaxID=1978412 RepID=A0ABW9ZQR7_9BACT|nr:hypothetical protein [Sediminibacterium roseum]NCI48388.1 hypothetical protein [Sediminibacterium roseum]